MLQEGLVKDRARDVACKNGTTGTEVYQVDQSESKWHQSVSLHPFVFFGPVDQCGPLPLYQELMQRDTERNKEWKRLGARKGWGEWGWLRHVALQLHGQILPKELGKSFVASATKTLSNWIVNDTFIIIYYIHCNCVAVFSHMVEVPCFRGRARKHFPCSGFFEVEKQWQNIMMHLKCAAAHMVSLKSIDIINSMQILLLDYIVTQDCYNSMHWCPFH